MQGMIVYSFGWRRFGHGQCNIRLALAARRIATSIWLQDDQDPLIVAQRTTAEILKNHGVECMAVQKRSGYEGSEEVTRQAAEIFHRYRIKNVFPVAQPVIHLTKCYSLVTRAGFCPMPYWETVRMIGWIGFDPLSVQPATRDPFRLVTYTARQMLFGYRPPVEQSEP